MVVLVMNAAENIVPPSADDHRKRKAAHIMVSYTRTNGQIPPGFLAEVIQYQPMPTPQEPPTPAVPTS